MHGNSFPIRHACPCAEWQGILPVQSLTMSVQLPVRREKENTRRRRVQAHRQQPFAAAGDSHAHAAGMTQSRLAVLNPGHAGIFSAVVSPRAPEAARYRADRFPAIADPRARY